MRGRSKLLLVVCVLALAACASGFGVYAAASESFSVRHTIRFQSEALIRERFELIVEENGVTIKNYRKKSDSGIKELEIPDTYRGKPVTSISQEAFLGADNLVSVKLPASLTELGESAFQSCKKLASVSIPPKVTKIPDTAFAYCDRLAEVTLPDGLTEIGVAAFEDCFSLSSVNGGADGVNRLPASLTKLNRRAFALCARLSGEVVIPAGVTELLAGVFTSCRQVTKFTVGGAVTQIAAQAFRYCTSLSAFRVPETVLTVESLAFADCAALADVFFPAADSASSPPQIADDAFTASRPALHVPQRFFDVYLAYPCCAGLTLTVL